SLFPVFIDASAIRDETGEVRYRAVNTRDISDIKNAQEELDTQREFLLHTSQILAESLSYEERARQIADLPVPHLPDCSVLIDWQPDPPKPMAIKHVDTEVQAMIEYNVPRYHHRRGAPYGSGHVVVTQRAQLIENWTEEMSLKQAVNAEHLKFLRDLEI